VPRPLATETVNDAISELEELGLIVSFDASKGLYPPAALVMKAAATNLLTRVLPMLGGSRLLIRLAWTPEREMKTDEARIWSDLRSAQAVAALRIARLIPGVDLDCLPVALGLWLLLRFQGAQPKLRLGALAKPFAAHAWLEVGGKLRSIGRSAYLGLPVVPKTVRRFPTWLTGATTGARRPPQLHSP